MLSIQKCREILEKVYPEYAGISNEQVEQIRDLLYPLALCEKEILQGLIK